MGRETHRIPSQAPCRRHSAGEELQGGARSPLQRRVDKKHLQALCSALREAAARHAETMM